MSATFDIQKFYDYFVNFLNANMDGPQIVTVTEERKHELSVFYLDALTKIGQVNYKLCNYIIMCKHYLIFSLLVSYLKQD